MSNRRPKKKHKSPPKPSAPRPIQLETPKSSDPKDALYRIPLIGRILFAVLGGIASVLGIAAAYVALSPDVSVLPPSSPAPSTRPFEEPFLLVNDGGLPVYNVKAKCGPPTDVEGSLIPAFDTPPVSPQNPLRVRMRSIFAIFALDKLHAHERKPFIFGTFEFVEIKHQPLSYATNAAITIDINYRAISILPWSSVTSTSFKGALHEDGKFYWTEEPLIMEPAPIRN